MHRFPVLVWEDFTGLYTARLIDDEEDLLTPLAATGPSVRATLLQLKEYLAWSFEREPLRSAPDFLNPQLIEFRVEVRPEYQVKGRIYPCDESIPLRVACVHGRQESGMLVCALPMLGLQFYYYEPQALHNLVTIYVQENLKNRTPQQLSRYLPPKSLLLEDITIPGGRRPSANEHTADLTNLRKIADPLGADEMRRSFSRAYERSRQVSALTELLTRERANVMLVGESGVGKTSVLVDAVRSIEREMQASERLKNRSDESVETTSNVANVPHKFWMTNAARLIAGMKYLGQWEERAERIIEELARSGGVLVIEDLLDLVRTGGTSSTDSIAAFILPYIERGLLRLVTETTPAGLDACRRLLPGFVDAFRILQLPLSHAAKRWRHFSLTAQALSATARRDSAGKGANSSINCSAASCLMKLFRGRPSASSHASTNARRGITS